LLTALAGALGLPAELEFGVVGLALLLGVAAEKVFGIFCG
jgi:hypothetical protein